MHDAEKKKMILLLLLIIVVNIYFVSRIPKYEGFGTNLITPFVKKGIKAIPNKPVKKFLKSATKKSTDESLLSDLSMAGFKLLLAIAIVPIFAMAVCGIFCVIFGSGIMTSFREYAAKIIPDLIDETIRRTKILY
tara:strand:- start:117 stop:521 length:405 start_codon:yes stop_codon:yes gene_type:complete